MQKIEAVYIHIPFCNTICNYCDFCKMFYNEKIVDNYLIALEKEIKKIYNGDVIKTIYIGGGTPSSLTTKQLEKLFNIVKLFNLSSKYEYTIEVNVNDITIEKLKLFKKNKINRISIGIETINNKFANFLNREINKKKFTEKINIVKKYFKNINIDLMYAFPNEKIEDLEKDLQFIEAINVPHISIYSLIIEEHTKIYIDKVRPINDELEEKMYYKIISYLKKIGYTHYEISNFAKKGYFSKHNLTYWNNLEYYGFGLGASGYINNFRYTNTKSINNYLKGKYIYEKQLITKKISMENEMILGLRKIAGINKRLFFQKYNFNIEQIFDIINLLKNKLLIDDGKNLYIPEEKLYISNYILVNFIGGSNE